MSLLLLLVLGLVWGSSYLFIKVIVGEVPPLTLVAGRLALSAVVMWLLVPFFRRPIPRSLPLWGSFAVMGLLSGMVPYTLISWGEQFISSGLAALLQSTMPIFTVILAHFLSADERMRRNAVLGVAIGFAGVVILLLPDLRQGVQASLFGQLAVIGSSLSYALASIYARVHLRDQPPLISTLGQLTTGALLTLPVALIVDGPPAVVPSPSALASWVGLAVMGTVLAYVIYYAILARTSATYLSTVTYIIPVTGLALGALVLGEPLSWNILISLALILAGVLLVRR